jgi:hypothetical protein
MRKFDEVEVMDETVPSSRNVGLLGGFDPTGKVIVELKTLRRVRLDPHQVDVTDRPRVSLMPSGWEVLDWLSE